MGLARRDGEDLLLSCYLQPRASKDEVIGEHDGAVKIRIAAPPVDGEANEALVAFLAKQFGVAKRAVQIESGHTGRRKSVRIQQPATLPAWLPSIAPPTPPL